LTNPWYEAKVLCSSFIHVKRDSQDKHLLCVHGGRDDAPGAVVGLPDWPYPCAAFEPFYSGHGWKKMGCRDGPCLFKCLR